MTTVHRPIGYSLVTGTYLQHSALVVRSGDRYQLTPLCGRMRPIVTDSRPVDVTDTYVMGPRGYNACDRCRYGRRAYWLHRTPILSDE